MIHALYINIKTFQKLNLNKDFGSICDPSINEKQ